MNTAEYIRCITDVIYQLPDLSSQKKEQFLKSIDRIRKRAENPSLHTALIGDYSTGKSTFINALLGQELLKMAWHTTTAVSAFISYHDKEGIRILAETADGEKYLLNRPEHRRLLEQKLKIRIPQDEKDAIAYLSATNEFAEQIKRIGIRVKSIEKLRRISLIDTPGVNPGAEEAEFHVRKTQEVLQKYADATIILFQAAQVYTGSFSRFLDENAKLFLNDAAFVITMMDVIEESRRISLIDYVRFQLEERFGIKNPPIFSCCAKAALLKQPDAEGRYWAAQFEQLREELTAYMGECRKKIIHRQLTYLMETLASEVDAEVTQGSLRLEQKKAVLEEGSILNKAGSLSQEEYKRLYTAKYKEYLYEKHRLEVLTQRCGQMHDKLWSCLTQLKRG